MKKDTDRLFADARAAVQPPPDARERVLARVLAAPPGTPPAASASGKLIASVGAVLAVAAVGAYVVVTRPHAPAAIPRAAPTAAAPSPPESPAAPIATTTPSTEPSASVAPRAEASARRKTEAPRASAESRGEDVTLLRDAQSALRGGDASRALALLDQHARRFPQSAFTQERLATQILAQCKLGHTDEASTLFARLKRTDPSSPHIASLRRSCPELE